MQCLSPPLDVKNGNNYATKNSTLKPQNDFIKCDELWFKIDDVHAISTEGYPMCLLPILGTLDFEKFSYVVKKEEFIKQNDILLRKIMLNSKTRAWVKEGYRKLTQRQIKTIGSFLSSFYETVSSKLNKNLPSPTNISPQPDCINLYWDEKFFDLIISIPSKRKQQFGCYAISKDKTREKMFKDEGDYVIGRMLEWLNPLL